MMNMTNQNFLFDLIASQPNSDGEFHGGGKYSKKVFFELIKSMPHQGWNIIALYDSSKRLDNEISDNAKQHHVQLLDINNKKLHELIAQNAIVRFYTALPFTLLKYGYEELLNTNCELYLTIHGLRSLETAFSIHSLQYLVGAKEKSKAIIKKAFESKFFNRDKARYYTLIKKTHVFAVSQHTKYSIMSFFPDISINDIPVFYSPDVTEFEGTIENSDEFNLSNFFLLISGNRWLKNNLRSAIALDKLFTERTELKQKVIITGVNDKSIYLNKLKNKDRFIFYEYVTEPFLKKLYSNCFAFIYMSLNEGFGYPPLEAMKWNKPVITSPFTSISEICGDAVIYSNPYSIAEIKSRILQLSDTNFYNDLGKKGSERYKFIKNRQDNDLKLTIQYLLNKTKVNFNSQ